MLCIRSKVLMAFSDSKSNLIKNTTNYKLLIIAIHIHSINIQIFLTYEVDNFRLQLPVIAI